MIRFLSRRRSKTPATVGGVTPPPPVTFTYLRPGGVDTYKRPDGTSDYIRP